MGTLIGLMKQIKWFLVKINVLLDGVISLQTVATINAGQAIEVRWKTNVGVLKVINRIMTIIRNL